MQLYLDLYFLENLIADLFLLSASAKACDQPCGKLRRIIAAGLGAGYSVLSLFQKPLLLPVLIQNMLAGLLLCLIGFGFRKERMICYAAFLFLSAAYSGFLTAIQNLLPKQNKYLYLPVFIGIFMLMSKGAVSFLSRFQSTERIEMIEISLRGKSVTLSALMDTGNVMVDALTHRKLLVCERGSLEPLFPSTCLAAREFSERGDEVLTYVKEREPDVVWFFSPVLTVTGKKLLLAFLPEEVRRNGKVQNDLLIAISETDLGGNGRYNALIGRR